MKRNFTALALLLLFAATPLRAQDGEKEAGPFKFAFGMQEKGGFGASLKGDENRLLGGGDEHAFFLLTVLDAHWDSKKDSPDQAAISLKPGVVLWSSSATLFYDFAATADITQRAGQFKTTSGSTDDVNQTLIGATLIWIPRFFANLVRLNTITPDTPLPDCVFIDIGKCTKDELSAFKKSKVDPPANVTLTYYKAVNESSAIATLPDGIDTDKIILRTAGDMAVSNSGKWRFLFDGSLTKPTSGDDRDLQKKIDVALGLRLNKFTPVIRYVNGKEGGFKYDRQVLLGLIWQLSGLPAGK